MSRSPKFLMAAALAVAGAVGTASPALGQVCPLAPGCTQTVENGLHFTTNRQSMWGPGTPPAASSVWIFDDGWNESGGTSDRADLSTIFGTQRFGGSIWGATSGRFGMEFVFQGAGEATVDIVYPVDVSVTLPQPNTFRPGEPVEIETSWSMSNGRIVTQMDGMDFEVRSVFGMSHSAGFDICFFACSGSLPFFPTITVPEVTFPLLDVTGRNAQVGDQVLELTDEAAFLTGALFGVGLEVKRPSPLGDVETWGSKLTVSGSEKFVDLSVDVDRFMSFLGLIGGGLGGNFPLKDYGAADLSFEIVDLDTGFELTDVESVSFEGFPNVRIDFPVEVGWDVLDPAGEVTESGSGTDVAFPVGHSLRIYTPLGVDPVAITPTYSLENTFQRNAQLRFFGDFVNRELALGFSLARHDFTYRRDESRSYYKMRNCDDYSGLTWVACQAAKVFDQVAAAASDFWYLVTVIVTVAYNYVASSTEADLGPLYEQSFARTDASMDIMDASWSLDGFEPRTLAPLVLDPEDPGVSVATSIANALLASGSGVGEVLQTIVVTNEGDVPLALEDALDRLSATGLVVGELVSTDVTANAAFDGFADPETLADGSIPVDGAATLTVRVAAPAGQRHGAELEVAGMSPIGTMVHDATTTSFSVFDMAMSPYKLKFDPAKKNDGTFKARVYGSDVLDIRDIDASSLVLEGVAPSKVKAKKLGDEDDDDDDGEDGKKGKYPYLELTFTRDQIIRPLMARTAAQAGLVSTAQPALQAAEDAMPPVEVLAEALLQGSASALSAESRTLADERGNRNGRLDLGDLRALALRDAGVLAVLARKENKEEKHPRTHTLVLSGSMNDGTPLWGEAGIALNVKEDR